MSYLSARKTGICCVEEVCSATLNTPIHLSSRETSHRLPVLRQDRMLRVCSVVYLRETIVLYTHYQQGLRR